MTIPFGLSKDEQYNGRKKKNDERTNNEILNITQKTTDGVVVRVLKVAINSNWHWNRSDGMFRLLQRGDNNLLGYLQRAANKHC